MASMAEEPSRIQGIEGVSVAGDKLDQFAKQRYLNLETYRKSGTPVATPVWFVEDRGVLYVYTLANAGKVKRIRNNPRVRIVPCTARGAPKGVWVEGQAGIVEGAEAVRAHQLLDEKYGWLRKLFNFLHRFRKTERVVIAILV